MTKNEIMQLVNDSLFANVGFIDNEGMPAIRRVFCTWHKGLGRHLISTNTSSMHVQYLLKNNDACLYFEDSNKFEGVCFTGKAIVHFEDEYKKMLWKDGDEQYYPKGIADEDYCILEFVAERGRFYRYGGSGNISKDELVEFDKGAMWKDYYEECT